MSLQSDEENLDLQNNNYRLIIIRPDYQKVPFVHQLTDISTQFSLKFFDKLVQKRVKYVFILLDLL